MLLWSYLQQSLLLRREIGDLAGEIVVQSNLGEYGIATKQFELTQNALHEALRLALQLGAIPRALEAYRILGDWLGFHRPEQAAAVLDTVIAHPESPEETRHKARTRRNQLQINQVQALPLEAWSSVMISI